MSDFFDRWRLRSLFGVSILLVASTILTAAAFSRPATVQKSVAVLRYQHNGKFDYAVTQKASYLYGDVSLQNALNPPTTPSPTPLPPQGNPKYPVDLVDGFDFTFAYAFKAGQTVSTSSSVNVTATFQRPQEQPEQVVLLPTAAETGDFAVSFTLDAADLATSTVTTIEATVLTTIDRNGTPLFETFTQSLPIKSDGSVFEVDKTLESSESASFGDLAYEQDGAFDYVVRLNAGSPFSTATLKPPVLPPSPTPPPPTPQPLSQKVIGPGDTIYTKLFDSANFTYSYDFLADHPVRQVSEEVDISAVLAEPGWSKTFVLVPTTKENGPFTVSFDLTSDDLSKFADVYKAVHAETGSTQSDNMSLVATVHVAAVTDEGPVNEVFTQTLSAPLGQDTLTWNEKLQSSKQGEIDRKETVANSFMGMSVGGARIGTGVVAFVFLLLFALVVTLNLTIKPVRVSPVEKQAAALAKRYRDMIVDVEGLSEPVDGEKVTSVNTVEELVKISDTLAKPILHESSQGVHTYCIVDGSLRYEFVLDGQSAGRKAGRR